MILIDASWPSNRLAAVTKRTLWVGLVTGGFLATATSFIGGSTKARTHANARGREAKLTPRLQSNYSSLRLRKRQLCRTRVGLRRPQSSDVRRSGREIASPAIALPERVHQLRRDFTLCSGAGRNEGESGTQVVDIRADAAAAE